MTTKESAALKMRLFASLRMTQRETAVRCPLSASRFPSIYNVAQIVCLNCFPLFIFHHGTYKVMEKRMRVQGSGFELRMELYSNEKGMVLKF